MNDKVSWKKYRRVEITEMRPYVKGEDMTDIAHPLAMTAEWLDKDMGQVVRDPSNPAKQWYITAKFFKHHWIEATEI
jgi:hypothetical protein